MKIMAVPSVTLQSIIVNCRKITSIVFNEVGLIADTLDFILMMDLMVLRG